jgi:membrane protein involved in colicin uptake
MSYDKDIWAKLHALIKTPTEAKLKEISDEAAKNKAAKNKAAANKDAANKAAANKAAANKAAANKAAQNQINATMAARKFGPAVIKAAKAKFPNGLLFSSKSNRNAYIQQAFNSYTQKNPLTKDTIKDTIKAYRNGKLGGKRRSHPTKKRHTRNKRRHTRRV